MEGLRTTTVEELLRLLQPKPGDSWSCTKQVREQLQSLDASTVVKAGGSCRFRLADDYPSYYITQIEICK